MQQYLDSPRQLRRSRSKGKVTLKLLLVGLSLTGCLLTALVKGAFALKPERKASRLERRSRVEELLRNMSGEKKRPEAFRELWAGTGLWDKEDYLHFLKSLPNPKSTWSPESLRGSAKLLRKSGLLSGSQAEAEFIRRAAEIFRHLRHIYLLRDLKDYHQKAKWASFTALFTGETDRNAPATRLYGELDFFVRLARRAQRSGERLRSEWTLLKELLLLDLLFGRYERAGEALVEIELSARPEKRIEQYRWLGILEKAIRESGGEKNLELADRISRRRKEIEGYINSHETGPIERLLIAGLSCFFSGEYEGACVKAGEVLRRYGIDPAEALRVGEQGRGSKHTEPANTFPAKKVVFSPALSRSALHLFVRSSLAKSGLPAFASQTESGLRGPVRHRIKWLLEIARLYFEGQDKLESPLPRITRELKGYEDPLAMYGLELIEAAGKKGGSSTVSELIKKDWSEEILAPLKWKELAGGKGESRPSREILVDMAEAWDELAENEPLRRIKNELFQHRKSKADEARFLYVETLYLIGMKRWKGARRNLEELHSIFYPEKTEAVYRVPGLSPRVLGPLYAFVRNKEAGETGEKRSLNEAGKAFELLLNGASTRGAHFCTPAVAAGMLLARTQLKRKRLARANESLDKAVKLWKTITAGSGVPPLLELEFIRLIDQIDEALTDCKSGIHSSGSGKLFKGSVGITANARKLLDDPGCYAKEESSLYEAEGERISKKLLDIPFCKQELRAELKDKAGRLFKEAALGRLPEEDFFKAGALFLKSGSPEKSSFYLRKALTKGEAGDFETRFYLGEALRESGHYKEACVIYREAESRLSVRKHRGNMYWRCVMGRGKAQLHLNQYNEGAAAFQTVYQGVRTKTKLWNRSLFYLGKALLKAGLQAERKAVKAGLLKRACERFREIVDRDRILERADSFPRPGSVYIPPGSGVDLVDRALFCLGQCGYLTGECDDAVTHFRGVEKRIMGKKCLTSALEQLLAECRCYAGDALSGVEDWREAQEFYRKAQKSYGGLAVSIWVCYGLARCAVMLDEVDQEAVLSFKRGRRLLQKESNEGRIEEALPGGRLYWERRYEKLGDLLSGMSRVP